MLEKMEHVKIGDNEYPITFNLNILEKVQEIYGSMVSWQNLLFGEGTKEPSLKVCIWTFAEMMNEAIDIENDDKTEKKPMLALKQVGRIISKLGMVGAIDAILKASAAMNESAEEEDPNESADPIQP